MNSSNMNDPRIPKDAKHGTTNVALIFKDGAVITTDRRASAGTFVGSNVVKKLVQINEHTVMSIAGLPSDAYYLGRLLKAEIKLYEMGRKRKITTKAIANLLTTILYNQFRQTGFPYFVQLLLAGFDENGPHVYGYDSSGGTYEEKYQVAGSGSIAAVGVLEAMYEDDMEEEQAIKVALLALRSAIRRDAASGDGMDMYVITKDGAREVSQDEIKSSLGDKYLFNY